MPAMDPQVLGAGLPSAPPLAFENSFEVILPHPWELYFQGHPNWDQHHGLTNESSKENTKLALFRGWTHNQTVESETQKTPPGAPSFQQQTPHRADKLLSIWPQPEHILLEAPIAQKHTENSTWVWLGPPRCRRSKLTSPASSYKHQEWARN